MANSKPVTRLDVLEQLVNDVLVQAGKALKSSRRDGRRVPSIPNVNRIYDTHVSFNSVLDDMESELTRAKAVLQRDLDQLRAKRRPVVIPEPVMIPQAAVAPVPPAPEATTETPTPAPAPGLLVRNLPKQPVFPSPSRPTSKPKLGAAPFPNMGIEPLAAPFPNMGIEPLAAPVPSPHPSAGSKIKHETASPQPTQATKPGVPAAKTVTKGSSPVIKPTSSPALKTAPPVAKAVAFPAVKSGSPALKISSSPALKTSSPVASPAKVASKSAPQTAAKTPLAPPTAPKGGAPVSASAPTPAIASIPTAATPQSLLQPSQVGIQPEQLDELLDLGGTASAGGGGSDGLMSTSTMTPHLNFTDMQFSLVPGNMEPQLRGRTESQAQGGGETGGPDTDFDLDTFVADATNNILSDSFSGGDGGNQSSSAAADTTLAVGIPGDGSGEGLKKSDADAMDTNIDELFRLDGPGGEADLVSMGDVAGGTNFDNLWIDGDTTMGDEFNSEYFVL